MRPIIYSKEFVCFGDNAHVDTADSGALLSDEAFYPLSFTAVDLPQAHITVSNIAMSKDDSSSVKVCMCPV